MKLKISDSLSLPAEAAAEPKCECENRSLHDATCAFLLARAPYGRCLTCRKALTLPAAWAGMVGPSYCGACSTNHTGRGPESKEVIHGAAGERPGLGEEKEAERATNPAGERPAFQPGEVRQILGGAPHRPEGVEQNVPQRTAGASAELVVALVQRLGGEVTISRLELAQAGGLTIERTDELLGNVTFRVRGPQPAQRASEAKRGPWEGVMWRCGCSRDASIHLPSTLACALCGHSRPDPRPNEAKCECRAETTRWCPVHRRYSCDGCAGLIKYVDAAKLEAQKRGRITGQPLAEWIASLPEDPWAEPARAGSVERHERAVEQARRDGVIDEEGAARVRAELRRAGPGPREIAAALLDAVGASVGPDERGAIRRAAVNTVEQCIKDIVALAREGRAP